MKLEIDKENCIGCGACIAISDELFEFDENGLAQVKLKDNIPEKLIEQANDSIETCPTEAIKKN